MDLKDVRLETCIKYMPGSNKKKAKIQIRNLVSNIKIS